MVPVVMGLGVSTGMRGVSNFAHGGVLLLGAYAVWRAQGTRLPVWPGMVAAPFVAALVGLVIEQAILRILPFDDPAAITCADIVAHRRRAGRPMPHSDTQVAAIARSRSAVLATCNGWGFEECGIAVVNPWTDTGNG